MKPIIILPPDTISNDDINLLRENGLCVVTSKNPSLVKFIDPIPSVSSRTQIEHAAIQLSRRILTQGVYDRETRGNFSSMFLDFLMKGTPLDPAGTYEEQERKIFDEAKKQEIRRLAVEEARAERATKKQQLKEK